MDIEANEQSQNLETREDESHITLTTKEKKKKIYTPWNFSVIIQVFGKKLSHVYLKRKLTTMWRLTEKITLIDLGYEYFIVKLLKEENAQKILQQGP